MDEGYGLNDDALHKLARAGTSLVVSVDCGIASVAEARTARQLQLELIVTDHHQFGPELPGGDAGSPSATGQQTIPLRDCAVPESPSNWRGHSASVRAAATRVSPPLRDFLLSALALAAIGTVADVVPLIDENRVLVKHGLVSLRERPTAGLAQLMQLTGLDEQIGTRPVKTLRFALAPRLNAAGRLGQAPLGVELLATEDPERAPLAGRVH